MQPDRTRTASQQSQIQQGQSGSVTLTSEQRTRVRQTVLAGSNVVRVNNVNFAVRVGTVAPTTVPISEKPLPVGRMPAVAGHGRQVVGHYDMITR